MALPVLVLPFVVVVFVALSGGKGDPSSGSQDTQGFNLKLPEAHFRKGKEKDKLGLYEDAVKDSAKIKSVMRNDPYYKSDSVHAEKSSELQSIFQRSAATFNQPGFGGDDKRLNGVVTNTPTDRNEQRVMEKLAQLKSVIDNKPGHVSQNYPGSAKADNTDMEKLQRMITAMKQNGNRQTDPELNQINGMLDKIVNIQHPEQLQDSMKKLSGNRTSLYTVALSNGLDSSNKNGFYGISETGMEAAPANAIEAVIPDNQTLVSGAVIKLRLLQNIYVHGNCIPKDQLIFGTVSLSNERLKIVITSLRYGDDIFPVSLDAYDMDGLPGIYIPGSINRDVSKQSADEALSGVGLMNLDPSLGAQAASAGIQAAKTLIGKKIKLTRVNIKPGYRVLLKDNTQK
jgi:conjugative transposon TraM protein